MSIDDEIDQVDTDLVNASNQLNRMMNDPELRRMFQAPQVEIEVEGEQ